MGTSNSQEKHPTIWKDRKHHMWFPWSFTVYELKNERLYEQSGLFNTKYDELLLYRVTDVAMEQSFGQKIFGTGTVVLTSRVDSKQETRLVNIKNPKDVKETISDLVEQVRNKHRIVGKEFFGSEINIDMDPDAMMDMQD